MDLRTQHRIPGIHSTNSLGRLNKGAKRTADVVWVFPNEGSAICLISAVLLKADDEWQTQHRYMQTEPMAELMMLSINVEPAQIASVAT